MRILAFIIIICLFNSCNSIAQTTPEKYNTEFFSLYKEKGLDVSLNHIFETNKWISANDVATVKSKLRDFVSQLGEYRGAEFVTKKSAGQSMVLYAYLVKYDRQPIKFMLTYYKADTKWQLQSFEFDPDLQTELREAARSYRLVENLMSNDK